MNLPLPKNYAEKVLYALSDAVTAASADPATKTVTYHRTDAARACFAMAAIMLNGKVDGAAQPTQAEIDALVKSVFSGSLSTLHKAVPAHMLSAEKPGFTTRTLA